MLENILVAVIVLAAVGFVVYRMTRKLSGQEGCACDKPQQPDAPCCCAAPEEDESDDNDGPSCCNH